jgi:hypothetical protein
MRMLYEIVGAGVPVVMSDLDAIWFKDALSDLEVRCNRDLFCWICFGYHSKMVTKWDRNGLSSPEHGFGFSGLVIFMNYVCCNRLISRGF